MERVEAHRVESAGEVIEARTVVVCAGPWTRTLVPGVATTPTLEHVGYVPAPAGLPIFIDFTEPAVYGLPAPGSDLYKIAVHHGGPPIDPDDAFAPDPSVVSALRHAVDRWLPGPSSRASTCARTTTPPTRRSSWSASTASSWAQARRVTRSSSDRCSASSSPISSSTTDAGRADRPATR